MSMINRKAAKNGAGSRWKKGGPSPNPKGRPKGRMEVTELARQCTEAAIVTLAEIMRNGENESARVRAAEALLDRGWGRVVQALSLEQGGVDGEGKTSFPVRIRLILGDGTEEIVK